MAGTFTVAGGNTTITFTQTTTTAKMQNIIAAAAHQFYDGGLVLVPGVAFVSLTNQQKLDIVDAYIKRIIVDAARAYSVKAADQAAIDAANADAAVNLNL
jgi:hypothetical protein